MPAKHIDEVTILTKVSLKDTEVLKILIRKGLKHISDEDYFEYINKKNRKK
ncbi:hypothetical protein EV694_0370 [Volucribacter psittacicida]|uniref:Uncharacterized protein n=1 Tax=Volucribacter psittacicida TaxID=203482 RepID=A0A4R1G104_9PAST|nr:hypothetical protein [Volucribacter psittacicida]TCK01747.1 hypothetical protein EV694_0370 [Volucribacter psittacicida]